jgi:hypothetical protein
VGIYLEPETTFSVSIQDKGGARFAVVEGSEINLRTATGREYAAIMKAIREEDACAGYDLLGKLVKDGVKDVSRLHPNVAALLIYEVAKRSHLTETEAGN